MFKDKTADDALTYLRALPPGKRASLIKTLLYTASSRPAERQDQQSIFLALRSEEVLGLGDRVNCTVAACHKSLELRDDDAVLALLPELEDLFAQAGDLSPKATIRANRLHARASIGYMLMMITPFRSRDAVLAWRDQIVECYSALPLADIQRSFFRSAVNVTRTLGLAAAIDLQTGRTQQAAATNKLIRSCLSVAIQSREMPVPKYPLPRVFRDRRIGETGTLSEVSETGEMFQFFRACEISVALQRLIAQKEGSPEGVAAVFMSNAVPGLSDELTKRLFSCLSTR